MNRIALSPLLACDTPGHEAQISAGLFACSAPLERSSACRYWWNVLSATRFVVATTYSVPVESAITGVLVTPMSGAMLPHPSMSSLDIGVSPSGTRLLVHSGGWAESASKA